MNKIIELVYMYQPEIVESYLCAEAIERLSSENCEVI